MKFLATTLLLLSFSTQASWESFFNPRELGFPEPEMIDLPWKDGFYANNESAPSPFDFKISEVRCPIENLWATHPQQSVKEYVYGVWASYRHQKFSPANVVVMSDLFMDECGNIYKAFWLVPFLAKEETMETLVSKGRTIMKKPQGFPGEYISGATYKVNSNEFLFLTYPALEDEAKIELARKAAVKEGYKLKKYQWVR